MATKKSTDGKPYPSVDELRERVLAGETVTEDEWMKARMRAELDELRAIADQRAAEQRAEQERLKKIREIRAEVAKAADLAADEADLQAITEVVERIITRHRRLSDVVRDARGRLAQLKVPAGQLIDGFGWHEAFMGRSDGITLDGETISIYPAPGLPIARALQAACKRAGVAEATLQPSVTINAPPLPPTPEELAERRRRDEEAQKRALRRIADRAAAQSTGGDDAA